MKAALNGMERHRRWLPWFIVAEQTIAICNARPVGAMVGLRWAIWSHFIVVMDNDVLTALCTIADSVGCQESQWFFQVT